MQIVSRLASAKVPNGNGDGGSRFCMLHHSQFSLFSYDLNFGNRFGTLGQEKKLRSSLNLSPESRCEYLDNDERFWRKRYFIFIQSSFTSSDVVFVSACVSFDSIS